MAQSIGAVERKNPLPSGVYWVDVFEDKQPDFYDWVRRYPQVVILRTSSHEPGGWGEEGPAYDWVLFRVEDDVPWEGPGFPTIAERGEGTTKEHTVQRPPPPKEGFDLVYDTLSGTWKYVAKNVGGSVFSGIGTAIGLGIGGIIFYKMFEKKKR